MTTLIIVLSLIALTLAGISAYLGSKTYAYQKKMHEVLKACEETEKKLKDLKNQFNQENALLVDLNSQCDDAKNNLSALKQEQTFYLSKYEQSKEAYRQQEDVLKQINSTIESTKKACEIAEQEARERLLVERKQWEKDRDKEYLATQEDLKESLSDILAQINDKSEELSVISKDVSAAIALEKQAYNESLDKWSLLVDKKQLMQYNKLKDIANEFDDKELKLLIGKIAWNYIWKNAYTQLIKRQFDNTTPCGIYKITNLTNNMCYIGQSVNVPRRWSEHIKCALGADAKINIQNYPLYVAMYEDGLENFKFELIAEYKNYELDEKEKFWQEFYHAKDFGYCKK